MRIFLRGHRFEADFDADAILLGGTRRLLMNARNAQQRSVFAFTRTDQCVSNTSVRASTYRRNAFVGHALEEFRASASMTGRAVASVGSAAVESASTCTVPLRT